MLTVSYQRTIQASTSFFAIICEDTESELTKMCQHVVYKNRIHRTEVPICKPSLRHMNLMLIWSYKIWPLECHRLWMAKKISLCIKNKWQDPRGFPIISPSRFLSFLQQLRNSLLMNPFDVLAKCLNCLKQLALQIQTVSSCILSA